MIGLKEDRALGNTRNWAARKLQKVVSGSVTTIYKAYAQIGASEAAAVWFARKTVIDETDPTNVTVTTTHATGDGAVASDLTALSYS